MRILILIITACFICGSCGVKDEPKYQSKNYYNIKINII